MLDFCWASVNGSAQRLRDRSSELREALTLEDKNSTGDKHETGRAMLHLEQEKLSGQLSEVENTIRILKKIDISAPRNQVGMGSLVGTGTTRYFLAVSAGVYREGNQLVYCISGASPMARLLLGKKVGDLFEFNGQSHTVEELL